MPASLPSWRLRATHLAIIDGVESMTGDEGRLVDRTRPVSPGFFVAGLNPACTDAVAAELTGFDPMADPGTPPFELCDHTMRPAEELALGTRDLARIEIRGPSIAEAVCRFRG